MWMWDVGALMRCTVQATVHAADEVDAMMNPLAGVGMTIHEPFAARALRPGTVCCCCLGLLLSLAACKTTEPTVTSVGQRSEVEIHGELSARVDPIEFNCEQGDGAACYRHALTFLEGTTATKPKALVAFLHKGCDAGHARSCFEVGVFHLEGQVTLDKDPVKAADLFDRACHGGLPEGCNELGVRYLAGEGVPEDSMRAADLYDKACQMGLVVSCMNLAAMYKTEALGPAAPANAIALYEPLCDGGHTAACGELGFLVLGGIGTAKNEERGAALIARGCDWKQGNLGYCRNLALLYSWGRGVDRDTHKAVEMLTRACDAKHADSCSALSVWYAEGIDVPRNLERAAMLSKQACDLGSEGGCKRLALLCSGTGRYPACGGLSE